MQIRHQTVISPEKGRLPVISIGASFSDKAQVGYARFISPPIPGAFNA